MNEAKQAKPFASLSSGLLARKGTAKPAMRPQGFGSYGAGLEDLGWNDMGHTGYEPVPGDHVPSSITALTPAPGGRGHQEPQSQEHEHDDYEAYEPHGEIPEPPVVEQRRALEASFEAPLDYEEEEEAEELQAELQVEPEHEEAAEELQPELQVEPEDEHEAEQLQPELQVEPEAELQAEPEAELEPEAEVEPEPEPVAIPAPVLRLPKRKAIVAEPEPVSVSIPAREKAAFTLRLDPGRHLRLRLACAVTRRSAQQIVTGALDEYLASLPELEALAEHVPAQGKRRG